MKLGGIRRLKEWPRCTSFNQLNQHLGSWLECLERYNSELFNCPSVLRSMILGIIPADYEDEILVRPEVQTYSEIIDFCKRRTTYKKNKALAELARRPPNSRMASLGPHNEPTRTEEAPSEEQMPSWAMKLFKAQGSPPPPMAVGERPARRIRDDRNEDNLMAATREQRDQKPNGRRAFNLKFRYSGCWHCGEAGHSRKANPAKKILGCSKFEALKARNNGAPPAGYKGVYEKARDAAWEKFSKKKSSKINALEDTDDEDFSDLDDSDGDNMFALTIDLPKKTFVHPNSFADLDESESDLDEDMIQNFSSWASTKKKSNYITIASLKDLDDRISKDSRLAPLPSDSKKLKRALRKTPKQIELENDEILCLIDTGSNVHAADAEVHFPQYLDHVKPTSLSRRGHAATSAGGHKIHNLGRFVVKGEADG